MPHECRCVFHLSGDRVHIRTDYFPELDIYRSCETPVISVGWWGYGKKFGKSSYWYKLGESGEWMRIAEFVPLYIQQRKPDDWQKFLRLRQEAKESRRKWRRSRNRLKAHRFFKNAI